MGYGYGVWLVYDQNAFCTAHLGHFTVSCFMTKEDAFALYDAIIDETKKEHVDVRISGIPQEFDANFYEDDDNDISSWGYSGVVVEHGLWRKLGTISQRFKCNFSSYPHTSIEYSCISNRTGPVTRPDLILSCRLCVVDITSDNPLNWHELT